MSSVDPQTPFNEYTNVNGVTTVFPYEFQVLQAADMVVKVDDVVVLTSEYVLSGLGNQSGGDVTFNTAPLAGSTVLLSRVLVLERTTDYQYNGDLRENTVDNDFNRLWQALQGFGVLLGSSVRAPFPEQIPALPRRLNRANRLLAFDSNGDPTIALPIAGSATDVLLLLSASSGASLVGYALNKANSAAQTVKQKLDNIPLIEDMVQAGDTDISVAWGRAAAIGGTWQMSGRTFTLNPLNTLSITTGFRVFGNGTTINHASTSAHTFSAVNANDWMLKDFFIAGPGKANNTAKGVYREGGNRFLVENVVCANMAGHGFYEYPGIHQAPRGDQGNWVNCRAYNCWTGREDLPAQSNEYNTWSNFTASGCNFGNITSAGNILFLGGNIVDNDFGVWVKAGENHAHGAFVGVNINHNGPQSGGWNIRLTDVDNGETFTGCHCYGDNAGTGVIWLERSKGMLFTGGILDASVYSEDATGYSYFTNNFCPDSVNTVGKYGAANKKIMLRDNFTRAGMWKYNDPGSCFVRASRAPPLQSITSGVGTTLVFNTESYDTRDAYNIATGVFTMPWLGNYKVYGSIKIDGASITTAGFAVLVVGGTPVAFVPIVPITAGASAVAAFSWSVGGAAGQTISVSVTLAGTGLTLSSESQLNIEEIT